jgi:hypothetical protein
MVVLLFSSGGLSLLWKRNFELLRSSQSSSSMPQKSIVVVR